jgi:hypothetical protein
MVEGVMIHHQPVGFDAQSFDRSTGLFGVFLPRSTEPGGMERICFGPKSISGCGEAVNHKSLPFDQVTEVTLVLAADKRDVRTFLGQGTAQGQAAPMDDDLTMARFTPCR